TAATTSAKAGTTTAKAATTTAKGAATTTPAAAGSTTTVPQTPASAASNAREHPAHPPNKQENLRKVGAIFQLIAIVALVFGLIYTTLWGLRTGLLSRAWATLGMIFGGALILPIIPALPGLVLWFAVLGLMFVGAWPRPLAPSWEAGKAVPWP